MIYEKLQQARIELQNKKLKKSGKNGYSGFTYYELSDFLPVINQIFYDLKLFSNFSIENQEAKLTITDWEDNTKEVFTSPIESLELKGCTRIQALGGIHTYMKRYLYLNALEIVESDLLDPLAGTLEEVKTKQPISKENTIDEYAELDIYEGLKETIATKQAFAYFQEHLPKVTDKTRFRQEYQKHYNILKTKENK